MKKFIIFLMMLMCIGSAFAQTAVITPEYAEKEIQTGDLKYPSVEILACIYQEIDTVEKVGRSVYLVFRKELNDYFDNKYFVYVLFWSSDNYPSLSPLIQIKTDSVFIERRAIDLFGNLDRKEVNRSKGKYYSASVQLPISKSEVAALAKASEVDILISSLRSMVDSQGKENIKIFYEKYAK